MTDQEKSLDGVTAPSSAGHESFVENSINLSLLDPPRWGWTAGGGIADILTPHERARRKSTKKSFLQTKALGKKRGRREAFQPKNIQGTDDSSNFLTFNATSSGSVPCATDNGNRITRLNDPLTIENADVDQSTHNKSSRSRGKETIPKQPDQIRFRALRRDDNSLDIRTYHRGREAAEFRDEQTGDLLCDTNVVTDTNFGVDSEPKALTTWVTIEFPLDDNDDTDSDLYKRTNFTDVNKIAHGGKEGHTDTKSKRDSCRYFTETIRWNLAGLDTPTPLAFASSIAQDFGLSYIQTLNLADSIQQQLQDFVRENCVYAAPVALRGTLSSSPSPHLQDLRPTLTMPQLYGEITGTQEHGGWCRTINQKSKLQKISRSSSVLSTRSVNSKGVERNREKSNNQINGAGTKNKGKIPPKRKLPRSSSIHSTKAEDIYYWQVRSRLHDASLNDIKDRGSSDIVLYEDYFCHICQATRPVCGVFPCCNLSHAYCDNHLAEKLQLSIRSERNHPLELNFCPICTLSCDCPICVAKLDSTASDFRQKCLSQSATPETTVFENLVEHCKLVNVQTTNRAGSVGDATKREVGGNSKAKRRQLEEVSKVPRRVVSKVPPAEFPREVADGLDLDHGYDMDYSTIFTDAGAFTTNPQLGNSEITDSNEQNNFDLIEESQAPIEDGNLDHCYVCKNVGNLVCCDYCPRAFHDDCIKAEERTTALDEQEKWECPRCRLENAVMPGDFVDGEISLMAICSAFNNLNSNFNNRDLAGMKLLSILHDMLQILMDYDFGYMFQNPVDTKQLPSYKIVVKRPMDLGTISSNLMNGQYMDRIRNNDRPVDDIALAILCDVELVWHNCFIFNFDGSAVYRMAQVQRKRAKAIKKVSFEHLLSEEMKANLSLFIQSCETERGVLRSSRNSASNPRQKAKHKIMGTSPLRSGKGRPVAVLDPDTGRIVKIYATMQSASNVVSFFLERQFDCEFNKQQICSLGKLRAFILQCRSDAALRLFGFRWLLLEDLRCSRVVFPALKKRGKKSKKAPSKDELANSGEDEEVASMSGFIEMLDGDRSYIFNSIEESLSFPDIQVDIATTREHLVSLAPGFDFTDVAGRKWKRLGSAIENTVGAASISEQSQDRFSNQSTVVNVSGLSCSVIVKEDLISGVALMGFRSREAAFQDWLNTLDTSLSENVDRSFHTFRTQYLDRNRNVDGIGWRSTCVGGSEQPAMTEAKVENSLQSSEIVTNNHDSIAYRSFIVNSEVNHENSTNEGALDQGEASSETRNGKIKAIDFSRTVRESPEVLQSKTALRNGVHQIFTVSESTGVSDA